MGTDAAVQRFLPCRWCWFVGGPIAVYAICILAIALHLEVGYFDAAEYLVAANALVNPQLGYPLNRAPLLSILFQPFTHLPPGVLAALRGPNVVAAVLSTMALMCSALLFWRVLSPSWTVVGVLLLVFNRMLVHYGALSGHDVPAMLLVTVLLLVYAKVREHPKRLVWMWPTIAAAALLRYDLAVVVAIPIVTEAVLAWRGEQSARDLLRRPQFWLYGLFAPGATSFLVVAGIQVYKAGGLAEAYQVLRRYFAYQLGVTPYEGTDAWFELFVALPAVFGLPLAVLGAFGLWGLLRSEKPLAVAAAITVLVIGGVHSFLIGHTETRHVLSLVAVVTLAMVVGMRMVYERMAQWKHGGVLGAVLLGLAMVPGLLRGGHEWLAFRDPAFHTPVWREVGAAVRQANGPLYLTGHLSPMFPEEYRFHRYDEYFKVFHFGNVQLFNLTGKPPKQLTPQANPAAQLLELATNDAVVVHLHPESTHAGNLPSQPPPIRVQRYRRILWRVSPADATRYEAARQHATAERQGGRLRLQFSTSPPDALVNPAAAGGAALVPIIERGKDFLVCAVADGQTVQQFEAVYTKVSSFGLSDR